MQIERRFTEEVKSHDAVIAVRQAAPERSNPEAAGGFWAGG